MTEPSPLNNDQTSSLGSPADAGESSASRPRLAVLYDRYQEHVLTTPVEMLGFWAAIALPFLYMPLLLTGISSTSELLTFLGLLSFNVAALLAGHSYKRE